jgi:hypothetical protein
MEFEKKKVFVSPSDERRRRRRGGRCSGVARADRRAVADHNHN